MFEVQMLVPTAGNDGGVFGSEHVAAFEAAVIDAFSGFTRYPSTAVGGWRNGDGVEYRDRSHVYGIAISSIGQGADIVALAGFAKSLFAQEAIALRYLGQFEVV